MGRTVPTFVQLIQQAADRWKKFRRALRREDQPHFDRLFVRVRCYTQAATYQCNDDPMAAILLSIALDQEKRLTAVEKVLQNAGVICEIARSEEHTSELQSHLNLVCRLLLEKKKKKLEKEVVHKDICM